jgi:hypothetical protein
VTAAAADSLPGDELIPDAPLTWDRETRLAAAPAEVWPWLVQLGRGRAGWYLPARAERLVPDPRRALRRIDPRYQEVRVGDRVPDYGPGGWFEARIVDPPHALVWWTERGRGLEFSWALVLEPDAGGSRLRVRIRMNRRLGGRTRPLLEGGGELADRAFISLMLAGLRERVGPAGSSRPSR